MLNFKPHSVTLEGNLLVANIIFSESVSSITPFNNNEKQETQE